MRTKTIRMDVHDAAGVVIDQFVISVPNPHSRLVWWLRDQWLRLRQHGWTADDWYANDCPPYPGQRPWPRIAA
jgi:hypothetical protein